MIGRLSGGAVLVGVYLLVLGSPKLLDVPVAILVAVGALATIGPSPLRVPSRRRPGVLARVAATPRLVAWVVRDVVSGTFRVGLAVVGVRPARSPDELAVDVPPCSDLTLVVTGLLLTLSPGSVLVRLEPEANRLYVHVLDAARPQETRDHVLRLNDLVCRVVGA